MTTEEHLLLITMFARERLLIEMIMKLLTSRGIAEDDDLRAYNYATLRDFGVTSEIYLSMRKEYLAYARGIGVVVPPEV